MCRRSGSGKLCPEAQARNRCALPGFHVGTWTKGPVKRVWMGRGRDYAREGRGDWAYPVEPIAEMGCPASWYLSEFYQSLSRYYRGRDDNGNRIANPALDKCNDDLVIEAIRVLEGYEEHVAHEVAEKVRAQQQRDAKRR